MIKYRLIAEPRANFNVAAAFDWYEQEQPRLGRQFLDELRATYERIVDGSFVYQDLRTGIR